MRLGFCKIMTSMFIVALIQIFAKEFSGHYLSFCPVFFISLPIALPFYFYYDHLENKTK